MGEYQGCGIELKGTPDDYPGVDAGAVHGAPEESLKGYQAMLTVQEHTAEVLVLFLCDIELTELLYIGGIGERLGRS